MCSSDLNVQMHETGKLKIIGTLAPAGKVESAMLKAIPSVNDSKTLKNFAFNIWTGYFVKKNTPEAVVQNLHKSLSAVLTDTATRETLEKMGMTVSPALSLAEASKVYETETAQFRGIAKSIKLEAQ